MRLLKRFFSLNFLGTLLVNVNAWAAAPLPDTLAACLDSGKEQFTAAQYAQAEQTFTRCLLLDPNHVEAHLSLAGVLLTQEKLTAAQEHFEAALSQMKRTSPYWSYTYSMLGDIALKQQQHKKALELYSKSLEYNAANVNSLIGKGVILETQGNTQGAAEAYESALAVEPLNLIARKRLIHLEPEYLTDADMLLALKQRYAVKPDATELTDANRELFEKIHQAEERRGVDYIKNKYGVHRNDYVVTLNKDTDFAREILTLAGYNALQKSMGQDALAVFRKLNIPVQDVFALRDKQGRPVFTKETTLTEEGFLVYTQALAGKKAYLLPTQPVPPTPAEIKKSEARATVLAQRGYAEISRAELKMLETKTLCSENTLKQSLGVLYLPVSQGKYRYFVRTKDDKPMRTVAYYYVMTARKKRNPKVEVPHNDAIEYYKYYGYTICLSDGNLTLPEENK